MGKVPQDKHTASDPEFDAKDTENSERDRGRPLEALFLLLTVTPFAILRLLAIAKREMPGVGHILMAGTIPAFVRGITAHFIIGTQVPRPLPATAGLLGAGLAAQAAADKHGDVTVGGGYSC